MINIPPVPANTEIRGPLIPDVTKAWKLGQLLNATVARDASANDTVLIRMGLTTLEAKTPIPLRAGETLQLLVKALGDTPVLSVQTGASPPQVAAQNLKNFISRQQDLTALLAASQKVIADPLVSRQLKQQLIDLAGNMPDLKQGAQADVLKLLIKNSGVFLESKLHNAQAGTLPADVKSQLLRIGAQLEAAAPGLLTRPQATTQDALLAILASFQKGEIDPAQLSVTLTNQLSKEEQRKFRQALATAERGLLPRGLVGSYDALMAFIHQQADAGKLRQHLSSLLETMAQLQQMKSACEGALAKITSQQLTPLTRESEQPLLLFDLHFKDGSAYHLINFRMEREPAAVNQGARGWTITLSFDFEELGPVAARLHLCGNDIHTLINAEKDSTVALMASHIGLLETALGRIGFDQIRVGVAQGSISPPNDIAEGVHLLDENA